MSDTIGSNGLQPGTLHVGWGSVNITPDQPVQLSGQMHERVSKFVHDPCTATALAIETVTSAGQREQAIIVCCDLVNVKRVQVEQMRKSIAQALADFDATKFTLHVTHTHTAPTPFDGVYPPAGEGVITPSQYSDFLIERVTEVARQAWNGRKPAGVSSALGHAALGFNRRVVYADGHAQMYGSSGGEDFVAVEGGMDPGIELLFTWDEKGDLTGAVVNVACPSQVVEGEYFVSADYWAPAREQLRKRLGANLFVLPMLSAAGDLSPRDMVRRGRGEPSMRAVEGMNELGRRLAMAVEYAFQTAQGPVSREVVFKHHVEELDLPKRKATAADVEAAREAIARFEAMPDFNQARHGRLLARARETVERFQSQGHDPRYSMALHVLRLGDVAIATNPFELFLEYGLRIKARSRAHQTFIAQIANDRGLYLPTRKAIEGGHYSAGINDNFCGPEAGDLLVQRTLEVINSLWPS